MLFTPTRSAGLERLAEFLPRAGRAYADTRNHDDGAPADGAMRANVSQLSPWLHAGLLREGEVIDAVLARHSPAAAEKFIAEVFWRVYFKGYLEQRPGIWRSYCAGRDNALARIEGNSGLQLAYAEATQGRTGIAAFDHWARELTGTGYLHNHARMWFASIWIFTLKLDWELGADFLLRHLADGDAASNTLSWRWVAGVQTPGKNYVARASNISKYTEGRFSPLYQLTPNPEPLDGPPNPPPMEAPTGDSLDPSKPSVLLLHEDDLSPGWLFDLGLKPLETATLDATGQISPLHVAPQVTAFKSALMADCTARWSASLGRVTNGLTSAQEIEDWVRAAGAKQIVTPYAPTGPAASVMNEIRTVPVLRLLRDFDRRAWPHATAGFFKFKDKIPKLIGQLGGLLAI